MSSFNFSNLPAIAPTLDPTWISQDDDFTGPGKAWFSQDKGFDCAVDETPNHKCVGMGQEIYLLHQTVIRSTT
jgi:hypothetical protein